MFRASDQMKVEAPEHADGGKDQASEGAAETKEQGKGFLSGIFGGAQKTKEQVQENASSTYSSAKSKVTTSTSSTKVHGFRLPSCSTCLST